MFYSQAQTSTPLNSQSFKLAVSQTQLDKSARSIFDIDNSSDSDSDGNLPQNSSMVNRLKAKFTNHLYLHRNQKGCEKDAVLYQHTHTNLIKLKHALQMEEVHFYKNSKKALNSTTLRTAIDEGLGNLTFEIKWAKNEPKWQ